MRTFQIWWLKLCCFLTGYNFYILSNCSEISSRKVKKYSAALLIVGTIWAFVGYSFCSRYIKLGTIGCIIGAIISVTIVVQIEKQILLADKANRYLKYTRIALALLMAIVGSLIIDQIIFKDDIDKSKLASNQKQVNILMPERTKEINDQINQINASLAIKETERKELLEDINRNPTTQIVETTLSQVPLTSTTKDTANVSTTSTILKKAVSKNIKVIQNPKIEQLSSIDKQIELLNNQKANKEDILLSLKSVLEQDVNGKSGFLHELEVMINLLRNSVIAMVVYIMWLLFFLILELLILIGKLNETESDYDRTIQKQMDIHFKKIELL